MNKEEMLQVTTKIENAAVRSEKSKGLVLTTMDMWEELVKFANDDDPNKRQIATYEVSRISFQMEILQGLLLDLINENEKELIAAVSEMSEFYVK